MTVEDLEFEAARARREAIFRHPDFVQRVQLFESHEKRSLRDLGLALMRRLGLRFDAAAVQHAKRAEAERDMRLAFHQIDARQP